jgi:hypothetical protein
LRRTASIFCWSSGLGSTCGVSKTSGMCCFQ